MDFVTCTPALRDRAIALSKSIFKDNMDKQFVRLFSPANQDHMFLAKDGDLVVSMVNYYPSIVRIGACSIRVASIGSVCTNPAYRGKNLASTLLQNAYTSMLSEHCVVCVISGGGGIYERSGATLCGNVDECMIDNVQLPNEENITTKAFSVADLPALRAIYDAELIRFERSETEFLDLIHAQTYPDTWADYGLELVYQKGLPVAYFVWQLHHENDELGVKEYGGDRLALLAAFRMLSERMGRVKVHFAAEPSDPILSYMSIAPIARIDQHSSLKIVDFPAFCEALRPYFASKMGLLFASQLSFTEKHGTYTFHYAKEAVTIGTIHRLNRLVFGPDNTYPEFKDSPLLHDFVKRCFPIPFVWTNNLNYQ